MPAWAVFVLVEPAIQDPAPGASPVPSLDVIRGLLFAGGEEEVLGRAVLHDPAHERPKDGESVRSS